MWQLFSSLGLYFSAYAMMPHTKVDASQLDLDPITVAGIVYVSLLKSRCKANHMNDFVGFALPALMLITEPIPADLFDLPTDTRQQRRFTASKWRKHLDGLKRAGLLKPYSLPRLHHIARYFAVPKNDTAARAIWNGKYLSEHTKKAPPVNLPPINDVIRKLQDLSRQGNLCMITADFRHFFHTIKVSEELSRYFGVVVENPHGGMEAYRWATLPMGWGPSPWIASSIGYAAILWRKPDEEILFEIEPGLTQLPTFVPVKGGGFLCLYYDNILVAHTDYNILEKVQRRLERNFSGKDHASLHFVSQESTARYGINLLKSVARPFGDGVNIPLGSPLKLFSTKMLCSDDVSADYLGVSFSLQRPSKKRERDAMCFPTLRHRQSSKKHAKWCQLEPLWSLPLSARNLAAYIGKILWRNTISMTPLCGIAPVIAILRRLASHRVQSKSTWDDENFSLTEEEINVMNLWWNFCVENPWHDCPSDEPIRHVTYLVSDSSDNRWGYLIFTEDGRRSFEKGHKWSTGLQKQHIFMKELCAAIFAIRHVITTRPPGADIHIGVDNSAAANALRNMYSGNLMACRLLDTLHKELIAHKARIFVHSIRSEDNASDPVSRGRRASNVEIANCFNHLRGLEEGHRISIHSDFLQQAGVAHMEHEWEDIDVVDLLGLEDQVLQEMADTK